MAKSDKGPLQWFGPCSVYFDAFVLPMSSDPKATARSCGGRFHRESNRPRLEIQRRERARGPAAVTLVVQTTKHDVAAGQTVSMPMDVYFGPKWRKVLNDASLRRLPAPVRHVADRSRAGLALSAPSTGSSRDGRGCSRRSIGWRAVLPATATGASPSCMLVAVVRLHPPSHHQEVPGPDDEDGEDGPGDGAAQEEVRRRQGRAQQADDAVLQAQGAAPILGCLPMFLQMPIWIALYSSLQTTFELRQSPFLWNLTWIHDLAKPDFLMHFTHPFDLPFRLHARLDQPAADPAGRSCSSCSSKYMTPPEPGHDRPSSCSSRR